LGNSTAGVRGEEDGAGKKKGGEGEGSLSKGPSSGRRGKFPPPNEKSYSKKKEQVSGRGKSKGRNPPQQGRSSDCRTVDEYMRSHRASGKVPKNRGKGGNEKIKRTSKTSPTQGGGGPKEDPVVTKSGGQTATEAKKATGQGTRKTTGGTGQ